MGVKELWSVIKDVQRCVGIEDIRGKRLAVDVSGWLFQSERAQGLLGKEGLRAHIRNLYYRIRLLQRHHVRVVIVFDGTSPDLKRATLERRAEHTKTFFEQRGTGTPDKYSDELSTSSSPRKQPSNKSKSPKSSKSPVRASPQKSAQNSPQKSPSIENDLHDESPSKPSVISKRTAECCELLDCMGVPYVMAPGEAEGMCAALERTGIVDGCITEDSDIFLFGARSVYRNFNNKSAEDNSIECYNMADIESTLGLNRDKLVAMALLTGCDYDTEGVKGIGKEQATQLLQQLPSDNILERLREWSRPDCDLREIVNSPKTKKPTHCRDCGHPGSSNNHSTRGCPPCETQTGCHSADDKIPAPSCSCDWHQKDTEIKDRALEMRIWKKVCDRGSEGFPNEQIIQQFLGDVAPDSEVVRSIKWKRPSYVKLSAFLRDNMKWTDDRITRSVLPLMTAWDMMVIIRNLPTDKQTDDAMTKPERILSSRTSKKVRVFDVKWQHVYAVPDHELQMPDASRPSTSQTLLSPGGVIRQLTPDGVDDEDEPPEGESKAVSGERYPPGVTEELQTDMEAAFPWVVKFFNNERAPAKGKRKAPSFRSQDSGKQRKIDKMFQARKKLNFAAEKDG